MKNYKTIKTRTTDHALLKIDRLPMLGEDTSSADVVECANLRRDNDKKSLVAAPLPGIVTSLTSLPFAVVEHRAVGRLAFTCRGRNIYCQRLDRGEAELVVGCLAADFRCAVVVNSSQVVVMTDEGQAVINIDTEANCTLKNPMHNYPALHFEASNEATMTQPLPKRELTGVYTVRDATLNPTDSARLASDLLDAYSQLDFNAMASGYCMQPVAARYRLLDRNCATLYVSPVVVVAAPGGFQCMAPVAMAIAEEGRVRQSARLSADIFKLRLCSSGSFEGFDVEDVETLAIETSQPVHPVDFDATAANAIFRSDTELPELRAFVPGTSISMVPATELANRRLEAVVVRTATAFQTAAVVHNPFGTGAIAIDVVPAMAMDKRAKQQVDKLRAISSVQPSSNSALDCACSAPHSFTAAVGTVVGSTMLWGDIKPLRFSGYPIESLMCSKIDGEVEWVAAVETIMADGTTHVKVESDGFRGAPALLSPMLTYPSADARTMKILLFRGREVYGGSFPLKPSADGTFAYYLSENCCPIELPLATSDLTLGEVSVENPRYADAVLSTEVDNPHIVVDSFASLPADVKAILPVDRRGGSWEYSLRRAYLFTLGGTILCSLDGSGRFSTIQRLDSRSIANSEAVIATSDNLFPVVAIAGSDLVGLSRGSLTTLASRIGECRVGWDSINAELWLADAEGRARVYQKLAGGYRNIVGMRVAAMLSTPQSLLILQNRAEATLRDTAAPDDDAPLSINYSIAIESPDDKRLTLRRLSAVDVRFEAAAAEGSFSVEGDEALIASLEFNGKVGRSLPMRVIAFPAYSIVARLSATLHSPAALRSLTFKF